MSEMDLAQRARAGDSGAFTQIVEQYQGPVFRLCARYLRGADSEDAAQETFVRAFVHRERFDPTRPLLPWLLTIARRLCLDRLRKKKPELDANLDATTPGGPASDPETAASTREELALLGRGLAELPEGQREAITRFHLEGMSYQEIAESLDVPTGTIMTWLHRGRARLRALLERSHQSGDRPVSKEAEHEAPLV